MHKAYEPDALAHLFDPDVLPGKHHTQVDFPSLVANAAACRDGRGPVVERVSDVAEPLAGAGRRGVDLAAGTFMPST